MTQSSNSFGNVKLIRRCGRVLIGVFILAVASNIFPLNLRSPDWGFGLSNSIVNSASLALVGMCLLRYSAWLDLQALTESGANPQILLYTTEELERSGNSEDIAIANQIKTEFNIKRLAIVGAISLVLMATWQALLVLAATERITAESSSVISGSDKQVQEVEQRIQGAPDQVIDAEWKKFQANLAPSLFTTELDTAAKRKELFEDLKKKISNCASVSNNRLRELDGIWHATLCVSA